MTITLVPTICDSTAYKDFDEDDHALQHYIVLYDDEKNYNRVGHFVPCHATYTPHFLTHKPPEYYGTRMQFIDFVRQMVEDYEGIATTIRNEVVDVTRDQRIGLVDLCSHGGQYTDARKQTALAYLLMQHGGRREKAWSVMLEWFGGEEDHWGNISDLYRHYVIPAITDHYDLLETDLYLSSDDSGMATQPNSPSSSGSDADSSPRPLSQHEYDF